MKRILIIGAGGQLGSELTLALREKFGADQVLATDIRPLSGVLLAGPTTILDAMDANALNSLIESYDIGQVYHLAAVLSAKGESSPKFAWDLNMNSLLNVLEAGKTYGLKIYWPSSIAVFGPDTPKEQTPQHTVMNPTTVYGISKQAGEQWCAYYHEKYRVDVRSLRYPGLIGYKSKPGGGTTDYAVDIFWKALQGETFQCFLSSGTRLPMMYMNDAVKGTIDLMDAPESDVKIRTSYNMGSMSFSPEELYEAIVAQVPEFKIAYEPDFRQAIADSWPDSIDDSEARKDWGWAPQFDLSRMTQDILEHLKVEVA
ncbi:MAG: NAD-dependent epimerase/dehydratase family protein [Cytophagales bacterium]|nr:NAD-dependent epimerase/dehydratase family protein [Cytophagales bacterium]